MDLQFPQKICKLHCTLYGLKQSPHKWYKEVWKAMTDMGFQQAEHDHTIFYKWCHNGIVIVGVYINHFVVSRQTKEAVEEFKQDVE